MNVLRLSLLVAAFAVAAIPADARIDDSALGLAGSSALSAQELAVKSALSEATDSGDAVEKGVLAGVRAFYAARNDDLLWFANRAMPAQAGLIRAAMDKAAEYGLDPRTYATPTLAPLYLDDPKVLAAADVEFSRAVARFVTHISSGRFRPTDISPQITLEPERPDIGKALAELSHSASVDANLAAYEPPHPEYQALKGALAKLRAAEPEAEPVIVPAGASLKPGASDPRVPLLRARLAIQLGAGADANVYDDALVAAVKGLQGEHKLGPDGIVGPRTLALINGRSRDDEIDTVVANMERWRWMPRDLGAFHIMVNIPEYMVRVVSNGEVVHETRVVVGKPTNPTPTFSNAVSYLIVNPYWNVPTSIVSKEMLPEIRNDPYGYFARQGFQVFTRVGGRFLQVDPRFIDWSSVNPRSVQIRQIPGDANALGRIKFMFPNQHSVYLHDTPSKALFKRDKRAFSHGCVRVENPLDFADALLVVAAPKWNSSRIAKLFGGPEQRINLDTPVPVHLGYFTAAVSPDGTIQRFDDIYGYDGAMATELARS